MNYVLNIKWIIYSVFVDYIKCILNSVNYRVVYIINYSVLVPHLMDHEGSL